MAGRKRPPSKREGEVVIARAPVPVAWTIWGVLVLLTLFTLLRVLTERNPPSVGGRGPGVFVVVFVLRLLAAAALGLTFAARRESTAGIIAMTVLLASPGGLMVAIH